MSGQHLDDIAIPDIEITPGWAVSDLKTEEDCDDAFAYLMAAVAEIEYQLELHDVGVSPIPQTAQWAANARRALKYKRAALQILNTTRKRLSEEEKRQQRERFERQLLDHIRGSVGDQEFHKWVGECSLVVAEAA